MVLGIIIFAASVIIMLSMLVEGFAGFVASAVGSSGSGSKVY